MVNVLYPGSTADETNCAREPIHIPGKIQPHGMLLAFRGETILYASENARRLHPTPLGQNIFTVVGPDPELKTWLAKPLSSFRTAKLIGERELAGEMYDLILHNTGTVWVLELERRAEQAGFSFTSVYQAVNEALEAIGSAADLGELWQVAARECYRLSGYDRVMIYQFDRDWNGTVVAESKDDALEPFLGLRYPASDIPAQARALYERNWIRAIPDVGYEPQALLAESAAPLDLSLATLRSVSPVHLQYLKNMGVGASMSVSLLRDGKLWGLVAFHHRKAKFLPFELRQGLEFLGKFLSLQITAREKAGISSGQVILAAHRQALEQRLRGSTDFLEAAAKNTEAFLRLVPGATGGAVLQKHRQLPVGNAPSSAQLLELDRWLRAQVDRRPLFHTDSLSRQFAAAAAFAEKASGLALLSIPEVEPAYLVWFKPEVEQTVQWAGKPEKLPSADGLTLGPRKSFALWQEKLKATALPFQAEELVELDFFRRSLIELDLERQVRSVLRSNEELDQFASAVAHDLKEPLRGIQSFAEFLLEDSAAKLAPESLENLHTILNLSQRARALISDLYSFSKVGRVELALADTDLNQVVSSVIQNLGPLLKERNGHVEVPAPLPRLVCDRVRVQEIFLNLFTNALKYNEQPKKKVVVTADTTVTPPVICVADNGIGIAAENRERIFRLFERLQAPEAYGGGTGVGLAITKRIVDRHGGSIRVDSGPNGSSFYFTLSPRAGD